MPSALMNMKIEICATHEKFCHDARCAVESAIKCGELLAAIQPMIKNNPSIPSFGEWVDQYLPFSHRSAKRYIKLHKDLSKLKTGQRLALLKQAPSINGVVKMLPDFKVPKTPESPQTPPAPQGSSESPTRSNGSGTAARGPQRGGGAQKPSAATLLDALERKQAAEIARGLTNAAELNGGEGPQFNRANGALNEMIFGMREMRKGKK